MQSGPNSPLPAAHRVTGLCSLSHSPTCSLIPHLAPTHLPPPTPPGSCSTARPSPPTQCTVVQPLSSTRPPFTHTQWSGPQVAPSSARRPPPVALGWPLRALRGGCAKKAAMTAAGREQERDRTRFVYVTRFGSHQCGAVLQLGGRRAQGLCRPGLGAGRSREEPQAAVPGAAGGGELCPGSPPRAPAASPPARASSSRSRPRQEAHAGGAKGRAGGDSGGGPRPVEGACWSARFSVLLGSRPAWGPSLRAVGFSARGLPVSFRSASLPVGRSGLVVSLRGLGAGRGQWSALLSVRGLRDNPDLRFGVAPRGR